MINLMLSLVAILGADADAVSWTSFRNGGSSSTTAANLPTTWSPQEGIAWQKELPGYGQSSPVVWRDVVFVTSVEGPMKDRCFVTALDAASGARRWSKSIEASAKASSNFRVSRAAPTPLVDRKAVYAFFESGNLIALTHDGQIKWTRSLTKEYGPLENHHGLGSSPAQTEDLMFLNVEHEGPSYLIAIDKATGQNRWKIERKSGMSWTSPIVVGSVLPPQVVISSSGTVDGYDSENGERLWSLGNVGGNTIPSPTAAGRQVFVGASVPEFGSESVAARSNLCLEIREGAAGCEIAWRAEKALCDYASPVVSRDCVYYVNKVGAVYCLDRASGRRHYVRRIKGPCWATPIAADGLVYFFAKNGLTTVINAGPEFREVAVNKLWELENPPKPDDYAETVDRSRSKGAPSGGMTQRLLAGDADGNGKLTREEVTPAIRRAFVNVDANQDGVLDGGEIRKMGEDFRKRRAGSRESNRDPIVYGVAATSNTFLIRTGTRLYCVSRDSAEPGSTVSPPTR